MLKSALAILGVAASTLPVAASAADSQDSRPRLVVITDIGTEPDDLESLVRLLTYANEIDIAGLIASTSRHLPDRVHPELIEERVAAYGKVLGNLRVHDPRFPEASALQSRIRAWRPELGMAGVGKAKANAASQLIIDTVDASAGRPVWVSIWGGAAPLAQALWTVQATRSPAQVARFVSRLRVYSISDQDDAGPWARATFPHLFWIASVHGPTQYELAAWTGISAAMPGADQNIVSRGWLRDNIQARGVLGATYPLPMYIMEGDTPSFLNLIANGLGVPERPDWGGWGGRWEQPSAAFGLWADTQDSVVGNDGKPYRSNKATIWRWRRAFQNDFAARMAWSTTPRFAEANHAPALHLNSVAGTAPVHIQACPGETVTLDASGSTDPDGHALTYRWWRYGEASGYWSPTANLASADTAKAAVTVPVWTQPFKIALPANYQIHVILEATDNGTPALTSYRRVVIEVPTAGRVPSGRTCPKIAVSPRPAELTFETGGAPSTAALSSTVSDIGTLLDNARARVVLERLAPQIAAAASNPQVRTMTLQAIRNYDRRLTADILSQIDTELARITD